VSELAFKIAALACAVIYMSVRSYFERKLGRGAKTSQAAKMPSRDRLELGVVAVGSIVMWLWMLTPLLAFADTVSVPAPARYAGIAIAVGSVAMLFWTHRWLAGNWSPAVERPPAGTLVTGGPYRWVRHPMYLSFLLYNLGIAMISSNWLVYAGAALCFGYLYASRVDREERVMLEAFGDEYRAYAAHTGRVIPGIGAGRLAGQRIGT